MKTFYSVEYAVWGLGHNRVKWFDDLQEAQAFASQDYTEKVNVHNFKNPEKIDEIEEIMLQQKNL